MRKRFRIALFILLAFAVGGIVWSAVQPHVPDPIYNGKPLSKWLKEAAGANMGFLKGKRTVEDLSGTHEPWNAAIRESGTNAIPLLLKNLRAEDSNLKFKFFSLFEKQRLIKIDHIPAEMLNQLAAEGFETLGPEAGSAVPALIQIYEEKISGSPSAYAAQSLEHIGPAAEAAVPALLRSMTNNISGVATNLNYVRRIAVSTLDTIHPNPETVLPALANALNDPDRVVRQRTIKALGHYGTNARSATAPLKMLLNDPDPSVRESVLSVLNAIEGEASPSADD